MISPAAERRKSVATLKAVDFRGTTVGRGRATAFGNSGASIVNGPGQSNVDMSLLKKIPVKEKKLVEFRAEFFNVFNNPQFSNPETNFSSSTFGQISSTSLNPRFVQFALKLTF